jgi:ABC-2 type transport system permease protein
MVPAVFFPWLLVRGADLPVGVPVAFLWGAGLGAVLYGAVFVMLGLIARHSLVIGLIYVVGFEGVMTRNIRGLTSLSIREFSNALTVKMSAAELQLGTSVVSMQTVFVVGALFLAGSLAYAVFRLHRYEMAERL